MAHAVPALLYLEGEEMEKKELVRMFFLITIPAAVVALKLINGDKVEDIEELILGFVTRNGL